MKIKAVKILKKKLNNGIDSINMANLDHFVVIAGKNGAGKSRLLNKVYNSLNEIEMKLMDGDPIDDIEIENYKVDIRVIQFKFKSYKLNIPGTKTESQINSIESSLGYIDPDKLIDALTVIYSINKQYWMATHQNSTLLPDERASIVEKFNRLNNLIKQLLNTEISADQNFGAKLFGFPLDICNLSEGQSALLQIAVLLFLQEVKLNEVILFFDEPEVHLHPSALNYIFDRLRECTNQGQIWIATHSVTLLSHIASFAPNSIWYMEDGKVEYAGRIPERVLKGLIGDEKGVSDLQDFCSFPAQYAMSQFALESLLIPITVGVKEGDKQTTQIIESLQKIVNERGKRLKLLDYGVGKGRLVEAIYSWALSENVDNMSELIDYYAFDEYDTDKAICLTSLAKIYGDFADRYFNSISNFKLKVDNGTFDFIIICNVMHEIPVHNWLELMKKDGLFHSLLADEGKLIWIEDRLMPKGEKAHKNGFLVFGPSEIKTLFNIPAGSLLFSYKDEKERLMKCEITKSQMANICRANLVQALRDLVKCSQSKIKQLRNEPFNYKKGKEHGFWSQQHINAILSLNDLGETP